LSETCFEIHDGAGTRVVPLSAETTTIGRADNAGVVLAAPWIAPTHARLETVAGAPQVVAVDGEVLVGGAPVKEAYLLSKLAVLGALVLVQSALLVGVLAVRVSLPRHGIVLPAALELYITIAIAGFAGIALGLALSAAASTPTRR